MSARLIVALVVWWWLASQSPSIPGPEDVAGGLTGRGQATSQMAGPSRGPALDPYARQFDEAGARHGVDANLLAAISFCESGFNPDARSPAGAQGLMQFMPDTAAAYGINPWDPAQAIDGAARYLADSTDELGTTDPALLAASYNAGRAAVARHRGVPPYRETRRYVDCITTNLS